jgi:hypothetical protein
LYLKCPEDGIFAPKHVGFFKPYIQLVILLRAFVGECDYLRISNNSFFNDTVTHIQKVKYKWFNKTKDLNKMRI